MKKQAIRTNKFKRDYKRVSKQGKKVSDLEAVMFLLINGDKLEAKHHDHPLTGNYEDHRECHIQPNWLLIYRIEGDTITFVRTGSHPELFG